MGVDFGVGGKVVVAFKLVFCCHWLWRQWWWCMAVDLVDFAVVYGGGATNGNVDEEVVVAVWRGSGVTGCWSMWMLME